MKIDNPITTAVLIYVLRQIMFDKTDDMSNIATDNWQLGHWWGYPVHAALIIILTCVFMFTQAGKPDMPKYKLTHVFLFTRKASMMILQKVIQKNVSLCDGLQNETKVNFGSFENNVWFYLSQWPITIAMWSTVDNITQIGDRWLYRTWFANLIRFNWTLYL